MRAVRFIPAVLLAVGAVVLGAAPAGAQTVVVDACPPRIDYSGADGTTFVIPLSDCYDGRWDLAGGSPTVAFSPTGIATDGQPLIWYQSIGRSGSACPEGWTPSYAEWPNDGRGGPTCDRSIEWGVGPGSSTGPAVLVTINGPSDWVSFRMLDTPHYVTGCAPDVFPPYSWSSDHVIIGCPG